MINLKICSVWTPRTPRGTSSWLSGRPPEEETAGRGWKGEDFGRKRLTFGAYSAAYSDVFGMIGPDTSHSHPFPVSFEARNVAVDRSLGQDAGQKRGSEAESCCEFRAEPGASQFLLDPQCPVAW